MMNGILAQLLSMLSFGTSNALWRKPVGRFVVEEAIVYRTFFSILFFFILLFTVDTGGGGIGSEVLWGMDIWAATFLISCISYFGLFFYNIALKHAKTGLVVIVTTSAYVFSQATSVFLLGERPKVLHLIPFTLFVVAILVSDYQSIRKITLSKGVVFGLLAAMIWGVTLPLLSIPSNKIGFVKTGLILECAVLAMGFLSLRFVQKKKLSFKRFRKEVAFFILMGALAGSGVLFNNLSYTKIPVYVAASISSCTHLVTILVAWLLFKEKLKGHQYLAAMIALIAIFITIKIF